MSPELTATLLAAYHALDRLPNYLKQATEAGTTMFNLRRILAEQGVGVEPVQ
jgi:hypothetical protein